MTKSQDFHGKRFDNATRLKLEIFREYLQEWLPVFLARSNARRYVNIYDFFAGPGYDAHGTPGSPVIILEEVRRFLDTMAMPANVQLRLFFNDFDAQSITALKENIAQHLDDSRYTVTIHQRDFFDAFASELPMLQCDDSANLVILDQFGYRFINSRVFLQLVECRTTDILFFISSANIKRFIEEDATQLYFSIPKEQIEAIHSNDIHRFICTECIQSWIPEGVEYHLAPFSIKKDNSGNIYGLIFGSGSLYGLEKFFRVCWNKDRITGEANFNIDHDSLRDGQFSLFEEDNVIKKQDRFRHDVIAFLRAKRFTNRDLYRFCLQSGFLPKHINQILRELQRSNLLKVTPGDSGHKIAKGAFYISWEEYQCGNPRAYFEYREG